MYLVDGNNVLGQRPGWHRDRPGAQRRLLSELAVLASQKRLRLAVVFDGRPLDHVTDGGRLRGVTVYFARSGSDADHRIVELLEADPNRITCTVVTSDRALGNLVRGLGVRLMRSGEFRRTLDAAVAEVQNVPVEAQEPPAEMAKWMRYFGVAEDDDDDHESAP